LSSKTLIYLSLLLTLLSLTLQAQSSWKIVDDIPKRWGMLERDSSGYIIYNPCDGGTPRIRLDSGFVTVYWQLDAPSKLHINKFTLLDGNRSFNIIASNEEEKMEFNATIKKETPLLVLWQFGDYKWVMTDDEHKANFRIVDNPCPTEMKREKQFLPVEF
jgi:hypothetical protein